MVNQLQDLNMTCFLRGKAQIVEDNYTNYIQPFLLTSRCLQVQEHCLTSTIMNLPGAQPVMQLEISISRG